ncbi:MAG: M10 family metallopeptidase C-terminal domain-containing protein, partial [Gammaproteobacteria bacterium]
MARLDWCKLAASAATIGLAAVAAYAAETVTHTYDARGRLVKVEHSGDINTGLQTEYQHDKADNRTNVTVTGSAIWGTPGNDTPLNGTAGDDTIYALAGADWLYVHQGGADTVHGGDGADAFFFRTALTAADTVDGGASNDQLILQGNYPAFTFGASNLVSIASVALLSSQDNRFGGGSGSPSVLFSYNLTLIDQNIPAGGSVTLDGAQLRAGEHLTLNASAESNGRVTVAGGADTDTIVGSAGNDLLIGRGNADRLTGGSGADTYRFDAATHSSGAAYDTVVGFDHQADRIDLTVAVTSFGSTVASGQLSPASFDTDMEAAMSSLTAGQARLFTPDQGGLAGRIFLIVDMNAAAGYQSGADLVVE